MPAGVYARPKASARFWSHVAKGEDCWDWTAHRNPKGYGRFSASRTHRVQAHRFAYEQIVGPIPAGLTLDHLCRNRACVNPAHPVTNRENVLRGATLPAANASKTNCPNGHPYDGIDGGARTCIACLRVRKRINNARYHVEHRAAILARHRELWRLDRLDGAS